jgi:hypothetical protein
VSAGARGRRGGAAAAAARALALLLLALAPRSLAAQFTSFGQNKVQYRRLEWRIAQGPHVDLYFYPEEAALAPSVLRWAEASYDTLRVKFGFEVPGRVPLIIYASHSDFEQTNVLPFIPPEGILGVTDFLKHRVTLPFRGNYAEFRHTLRHELVHVFQLAMLGENYARTLRDAGAIVPLWWSEGLAEHWSAGQDARDEMVMRDLVLSGRLPRIQDLTYDTSILAYPLGGRIHDWLAATYGDWRAALFYREAWRYQTFEDAVLGVYGRTLAQLNDEFQLAMRRAYLPVVAGYATPSTLGRILARGAVKPTLATDPDGGDEAVFYRAPGGYIEVAARSLERGKAHTIVRSGRSADLAAFHPFESRMDASRPGLILAGLRVNDRDALVIYDRARHKVVGRYQFPGLVSVVSPAWLPGDSSVVFSGLAFDGVSDLYRFTFRGERLERLTDDHYQDLDPSPAPDGRTVVFASDRTPDGPDGAMNLFQLDLATRAVRPLTRGRWVDESPRWGPDGRIYYASDRDGVLNIFSLDTLGHGRRESSTWTGAFDPQFVPGREALLVGTFQDLTFSVALLGADTLARRDTFTTGAPPAEGAPWTWPAGPAEIAAVKEPAPYRSKLTVDLAFGTTAYLPSRYTSPGVAVLLSDVLGDHVALVTGTTYIGKEVGGALENLNGTAVYFDQSRRLNWGVGVFRLHGYVYEVNRVVDYRESATGAFGTVRYPLSRFRRAEATVTIEHSDRFDFTLPVADPHREGIIATQSVGYVFDNSVWTGTGPIDGQRFGLFAGVSNDLTHGRFDGWSLSGDWRAYLRTSRQSAYAIRALGYYAGGERPRRINIGGSLGMRGFPWYGYVSGSQVGMLNQEFRFPLWDRLTFGFPAGNVTFPGVQAAFFGDLGAAQTTGGPQGPLLGSYGVSWRMGLPPFAVLRLDWGHRRVWGDPAIYGLPDHYRSSGFVTFFFGYNY